MAEHERKQGEWPIVKRNPVADFKHPDGFFRSGRPVAGPLRMGTTPGVGPRGLLGDGPTSDYGMDRISPRGFDPMGTSDTRAPAQESSSLLSRSVRGRGDGGE
jgi:hypothetical protein